MLISLSLSIYIYIYTCTYIYIKQNDAVVLMSFTCPFISMSSSPFKLI